MTSGVELFLNCEIKSVNSKNLAGKLCMFSDSTVNFSGDKLLKFSTSK